MSDRSIPILVTIPASHYCEKARWALERAGVPFRERGHLPLVSRLAGLRHGAWSSVPILRVDGAAIPDSTAILKWVDERTPPERRLYPEPVRSEVEEWEERFDARLGPHTRRLAYAWVLDEREVALAALQRSGVPMGERALAAGLFPVFRTILRRGMRIDPAGVARSRERIGEIFARVTEILADGRRHLLGDRFTAADLTFAALAAPVVIPKGYGGALPEPAELPAPARAEVERFRDTPAGDFALRLYREERR